MDDVSFTGAAVGVSAGAIVSVAVGGAVAVSLFFLLLLLCAKG